MSLVAIVPIASRNASNVLLDEAGFGPRNFSVPVRKEAITTHAALHAWNDLVFFEIIKLIPEVIWEESDGDPVQRLQGLIDNNQEKSHESHRCTY